MGKHSVGGMRSMMFANNRADERYRKKAFLRNKDLIEAGKRKRGCADKNVRGE